MHSNIIILVPASWPAKEIGGSAESLHQNCLSLSKLGFNIKVFTTNKYLKSKFKNDSVYIVNKFYKIYFYSSIYNIKFLKKVLNFKTDYIYILEDYFWIFNLYFTFLAFLKKIKKIYIFPRGSLSINNLKRKSFIQKKIFIFIFESLIKLLKLKYTYIFTSLIEKNNSNRIIKFKNFSIIPNRINTDFIYCEDTLNDSSIKLSDNKTVLIVSRISYEKNIFRSIDIIQKIRKKNLNIKVIICGALGNAKNAFKIMLENNKDFVEYLGVLSTKELRSIYKNSDALLLSSTNENFSNCILEAISQNCPVVTNNTNPWSFINKDNSGICCPNTDDDLVNSLIHVLKQGKDYYKKGCQITLDRFSSHNIDKKWINLFNL